MCGDFRQHHSTYRYTHNIMYRESLATDIEGVESVGIVGVVFEEVFFALGEFLAKLDLAEAVAPSADSCQLDGKDKVRVAGAVEEWYEALLVRKALVDEEIFLIVAHRVAEINSLHLPALAFKLVDDHSAEVLFVDGIVAAEGGSIVVEDGSFVLVALVVGTEAVDKHRCLVLELDVARYVCIAKTDKIPIRK